MLRKAIYQISNTTNALFYSPVREAQKILGFGEKGDLQELQSFRIDAFKKLIRYAYDFVPYYRQTFSDQGIHPNQIQSLEDIVKLPVLTKDIVRAAGNSLQSIRLKQMKYITTRSGGTTGEPITSYVNKKAQALGTYSYLRGLEWMGWKPGIPMITLFGGSLHRPYQKSLRSKLREYVLGTVFLPAFELSKENAADYMAIIKKNSPCVLKGYASAIYNLALYAEQLEIKDIHLLYVFSTAELMLEQWSTKISEVFNCPVKNYYGCGEINSLGFQIEQGGPYIVPDEHVIMESLNTQSKGVQLKNTLLVTSLFNYAQPLIRYQLGDIGEVSEPGIVHPTHSTISNLIGRTSDMFVREDGTTISPSLAPHIISKVQLPVIKYQFVQIDINTIHFLYDTDGPDLTEIDMEEVASIIRSHISKNIDLEFFRTKEFVLSKNGKFRIVISQII